MTEFAQNPPHERPPFSNRDMQLLASVTGSIDETCRAFSDPLRRGDALMGLLLDMTAMARDQAKTSPVLSAALVAEAYGAVPDYNGRHRFESELDDNKNIAYRVKTHIKDTLDRKFRLESSGVPEDAVANEVISMVTTELSVWQRGAVDDPLVDAETQQLAILAFMAGATAGQPRFGAVNELMRYASANITHDS